jgi:hypothetical protein
MNTEACRYDYANLKPVASITGYDNLPVNNQQAVMEHLATVSCLIFQQRVAVMEHLAATVSCPPLFQA